MDASRHKVYQNSSFKPGDLTRAFKKLLLKSGADEAAAIFSAEYNFGKGGKVRKEISSAELDLVTSFSQNVDSVSLMYSLNPERPYDKDNHVVILGYNDGILITLSSKGFPVLDSAFEILEDDLQLLEMPKLQRNEERIAELEARVEILEAKIHETARQLSCFLSYRFNARGKLLAHELSRFMSLLNVKVVTGMGYEPRRITEKVTEKLRLGHDFLVYLITKDGESTWIRDELIISHGSCVPVIILVEKGAGFEKGILGDWEYIEFDGDHISDTFISILEAMNFLAEQKARNTVQPEASGQVAMP